MELIKEIHEIDLGLTDENSSLPDNVRKAARIVLFNEMNKIALLYVAKDKYHKLPGGGVENKESTREALIREVREEVGANAEVLGEIGVIMEFRGNFLQISYCFYGKVVGEIEKPSFTDEEQRNGFELKWFDLDTAIDILSTDNPLNYVGKFIQKRDICILKSYRNIIDK